VRVLLDHDRRQAFVARHAADGAQQLGHDDRRQAFQRLVQQQQFGVEHQRAAEGQHLLLAARQLVPRLRRRSSRRGKSWNTRFTSQGPGRATALRFSSTVSDLKMLRSCGTQPMPAAARRCAGSVCRSCPASTDGAGVAPRHAHQRVHQRGLAGAVAAQQRQRRPASSVNDTSVSTTASP
jgi:hypothetical protein